MSRIVRVLPVDYFFMIFVFRSASASIEHGWENQLLSMFPAPSPSCGISLAGYSCVSTIVGDFGAKHVTLSLDLFVNLCVSSVCL